MAKWKSSKRIVLICYAVFVAVWVLLGTFWYATDNKLEPRHILMQEATLHNLKELPEADWFISTSEDPQIIIQNVDKTVRQVILVMDNQVGFGEMDLYYTRSAEEDFTPNQRVWGALQEDGSYRYILPLGKVVALRIDPGNHSNAKMNIQGIKLNPSQGFAAYFPITLYTLALFVLVPALASCIICTIIEIYLKTKTNRVISEE